MNNIYSNTASLTFDDYVKDMMLSLGVSESGVDALWRSSRPSEGAIDGKETSYSNKPLIHLAEDFYRLQLYPGQHFEPPPEILPWRNRRVPELGKGSHVSSSFSVSQWVADKANLVTHLVPRDLDVFGDSSIFWEPAPSNRA